MLQDGPMCVSELVEDGRAVKDKPGLRSLKAISGPASPSLPMWVYTLLVLFID